jgi:intergrase/recombinase
MLKKGKRHLWLGFRVVFNFLEAMGVSADELVVYRKALPTFGCGVDLNVPEEVGVLESLRKLSKIPEKYVLLFNVLLDSGLRLVEAVKVISEFKSAGKLTVFIVLHLAILGVASKRTMRI